MYGRVKDATWIAYRESTNTAIAKGGLAWIIACKQLIDALRKQGKDVSRWGERLCANVDCFDKQNAESILFDVVTELQTNDLLIVDFGQLYHQARCLYQQRRPDFILRDDFENAVTADKPAITDKIIGLLNEAKGGMAGHGVSLTD